MTTTQCRACRCLECGPNCDCISCTPERCDCQTSIEEQILDVEDSIKKQRELIQDFEE
jgi:hypothetical protein